MYGSPSYQKEKQFETSAFKEEKALIQYYVYQDFQNIINLLYSMKEIQQYFAKDPNHPAITISKNKVILQLNLSNSIHYDLERTHDSIIAKQCIYEERCQVIKMLKNFQNEFGQEQQQFLQLYKNNSLNPKVGIIQLPLEQIQDFTFNQNLVNQLIPQLELIESQIQKIKEAQYYRIPNENEIKNKALQFKEMTNKKLQISYPRNSQFQQPYAGDQYRMQQRETSQIQNYTNIGDPDFRGTGKQNSKQPDQKRS